MRAARRGLARAGQCRCALAAVPALLERQWSFRQLAMPFLLVATCVTVRRLEVASALVPDTERLKLAVR